MKEKGLTLIELLIVIGIILSLSALILSGIWFARGAAYRAKCTSNLKQLYLVLKSYEEAFDAAPTWVDQLVAWNPQIRPVLICPADPTRGMSTLDGRPRYGSVPHSYEIHYFEPFIKHIWLDRTHPDHIVAFCVWHYPLKLEPPPDISDFFKDPLKYKGRWIEFFVLAVFNDGRVARWRTGDYPKGAFKPLPLPKREP